MGILSCSNQPTDSEKQQTEVQAVLRQISGCGGHELAKAAVGDSCFSYQFTQNLTADFCVWANCCPDSQRFELAHEIRNDTIFVAVADTAAHLCRCICKYAIHAEFTNLPRDRYVFWCHYDDAMVYNEVVKRTP
jgi:hypothetical protein